eukprot:scaffold26730_cov162-Skeletonema_menzelii.AAC.7
MTRRRNHHHSRQKRRPRASRSSSSRCSLKKLGAASGRTQMMHDEVKSERCRSHRISNQMTAPAPLVHTTGGACTPFPLAVYRPASLMTMLLVASLLPKNTFSLRWLVLSGGGGGWISESRRVLLNGNRQLFQGHKNHAIQSQSCLTMAADPDTCMGECNKERDTKSSTRFDRNVATALWNEVVSLLEEETRQPVTSSMHVEDNEQDWSRSVVDSIPRGGDIDDQKSYAGLVNLGNTCYLNSQLQCAYHVPYLRQLVLSAQDEVVEVEVEVEVEEEKKDDSVVDEVEVVPNSDDTNEVDTNNDESTPNQDSAEQGMDNDAEEPQPTKTQTVRKTELKQEVRPISIALRSLQHTFSSLSRAPSSGTTNILCRALGINPYVQQDGQEFWKLFIPEVDYDQLSQLYSGYFEDYVREILPGSGIDGAGHTTDTQPRERVRTEPFLDLSIPVAEGNVGSIETSLQEMFTEPETLRVSEGNGWRPEKGAEKVDALKGSSLKREGLPSVLQLHLKRFKYDWETGETSKINDCVKFPLRLSLSEIISGDGEEGGDDTVYDLQSIVIHRGEYGSGHYYSYVRRDIRSDDWYRFDDSQVTRVDYREVVADAYGGRYRRKRSQSVEGNNARKKQRGLFSRIFSFGRSSSVSGGGFGYGGRTSSAYMLQYVRRSDIPRLYLEDSD